MYEKLITDRLLARFCAAVRVRMYKEQGDNARLIAQTCDKLGVTDARQVAYILGTAHHECRFKAIPEIRAKRGTVVFNFQERYWHTGFYGRGFPQLTWKKNYLKFSPVVGIDLVKNPEAVLSPEIGATILVYGMMHGSFTALKLESKNRLSKYFPPDCGKADWMNARKIVNGTFQADKVATAARIFLDCIGKEIEDNAAKQA